jgi:hypothetical protein
MYGTHLAINHLVLQADYDIRNARDLLDQRVTDTSSTFLQTYHVLHLHCWHIARPFSKFQFKKNLYDNIDQEELLHNSSAAALVNHVEKHSPCSNWTVKR